ncbi:rod shape-determining protein MreC [Thalassotalea agarivorans]|uniref:Cell shape-determining protein MreC n=1 Tax=Thalassotalea agarivorans TaxID=349064 RepID=A0A1I0FYN1_THASX|nr:rod shape-determining protein MreC [Thalassotalea agarivorans]SET63652.1 rod shape-determining protein MreC [Thalassotalea agarivorans]
MNPIFKNGLSIQQRLLIFIVISVGLIFMDHQMKAFESVRGAMQSVVSPLQYLATTPKRAMTWAAENVVTRRQLMQDNEAYKLELLSVHESLMQLEILRQENDRLRNLLASPLRPEIRKMVAEVLSVDSDPYTHHVVINRGTDDGVYEGQPVLDETGIVGQILHVGATSSRVILITDVNHAVPVRIKRNGIRLVATGTGKIDQLIHNFVPHSTDIKSGDILVTSGLGGKYPEGYPVAEVTTVVQDDRAFAKVLSRPVASIDRLRYVLLLWSQPAQPKSIKPDAEVK